MPTVPSIIGGLRPIQIDNPVEKMLTLRHLAQQEQASQVETKLKEQQVQHNTLALAGQQREAAGVEAVSSALRAASSTDDTGLPKTDYSKAAALLSSQGFTEQAQAILKAADATEASRITMAEHRAKYQQMGREHLGELALGAQRSLKSGAAPEVIKNDLLGHIAVAAGDGLLSEQDARGFLAQIKDADPNALMQIFDQYVTPGIREREGKIAKESADTAKVQAEVAGTLPETPAQKSTRLLGEARLKVAQQAQQSTAQHQRNLEATAAKAADPFGLGGQGGSASTAAQSGASGDDFLKTLPPQIAGEVKAYAEGKRPFPTGMSYAKLQPLIAMVGQYDPSFDAANYNARNKARTDLTSPSGTGGKTINALNTAIQHAGKLSDLIETLDNTDYKLVNTVRNAALSATGSTKVTNFEAVAPQLAKEIERAWRGAGGSAGEIKELTESIGKNLGKQQQREVLANFVELAKGKLDATESQRDSILGPVASKSIPILFEHSKPIIDTITKRASGDSGQSMRREIPGHAGKFAVSSDGGKTWTAE